MINHVELIEKFKPYIVEQEIRQLDLSGGDSSQRDGHFWFMVKILGIDGKLIEQKLGITYEGAMKSHEVAGGFLYRRTSNPAVWDNEPRNFTRDQWNALQLAWAANGDYKRLLKSMLGLVLRLGFHQNYHIGKVEKDTKWWQIYKIPDFMHPSHISVFIRGMNLFFMRPMLEILDLTLIVDVLYSRKTHLWDSDNMLLPHMVYANYKYSTFASRYALKKYKETDYLQRLKNYHSIEKDSGGEQMNGIEPMSELFEAGISSVFNVID